MANNIYSQYENYAKEVFINIVNKTKSLTIQQFLSWYKNLTDEDSSKILLLSITHVKNINPSLFKQIKEATIKKYITINNEILWASLDLNQNFFIDNLTIEEQSLLIQNFGICFLKPTTLDTYKPYNHYDKPHLRKIFYDALYIYLSDFKLSNNTTDLETIKCIKHILKYANLSSEFSSMLQELTTTRKNKKE